MSFSEKPDFLKDFVHVDVSQFSATFDAVKKFLGEKGPFSLFDRKGFTIAERQKSDASAPQDVQRVSNVNFVLGFGVHSIKYKGFEIWIWYRQNSDAQVIPGLGFSEKLTLFTKPFPPPAEVEGNDPPEFVGAWQVLKSFVNEALEFEQTENQEETKIYTINEQMMVWNLSTERPKRPMTSVFIKKEIKDEMVTDLDKFFKNRKFYASHGISYKRGYLLYGPPGCGKTSLVSALAGKYGMSICLLQIGHKTLTDNVLHALFMNAPPRSIILIEDIDTLFVERSKVNTNQSVTFSGFINALDGVGSAEGKVIVITTNHPSKVDTALLRPGRIDKQFKIDYAEKPEIEEMFLTYFPGKKKRSRLFSDSVSGNSVTTADLQQHFIRYSESHEEASKRRYDLVDTATERLSQLGISKEDQATSFSLSYLWS